MSFQLAGYDDGSCGWPSFQCHTMDFFYILDAVVVSFIIISYFGHSSSTWLFRFLNDNLFCGFFFLLLKIPNLFFCECVCVCVVVWPFSSLIIQLIGLWLQVSCAQNWFVYFSWNYTKNSVMCPSVQWPVKFYINKRISYSKNKPNQTKPKK